MSNPILNCGRCLLCGGETQDFNCWCEECKAEARARERRGRERRHASDGHVVGDSFENPPDRIEPKPA